MSHMPSSAHPRLSLTMPATDASSDSDSSSPGYRYSMDSTAQGPIASVQILRCMRCARSAETTSTDDASTAGMVRVSHGLYYCDRCAKMVGYEAT